MNRDAECIKVGVGIFNFNVACTAVQYVICNIRGSLQCSGVGDFD